MNIAINPWKRITDRLLQLHEVRTAVMYLQSWTKNRQQHQDFISGTILLMTWSNNLLVSFLFVQQTQCFAYAILFFRLQNEVQNKRHSHSQTDCVVCYIYCKSLRKPSTICGNTSSARLMSPEPPLQQQRGAEGPSPLSLLNSRQKIRSLLVRVWWTQYLPWLSGW